MDRDDRWAGEVTVGGRRLMVFLTEDDRVGRRSAAEALVEAAAAAGIPGVSIRRGIEGFGPAGHVRAERLPDLARGLPLLVEVVCDEEDVSALVDLVGELAKGALVTIEPVESSGLETVAT